MPKEDPNKEIQQYHTDDSPIGEFNNTLQEGGNVNLNNVKTFKLRGFLDLPQYPRAFAEALPTSTLGSTYYDVTNNVIRTKTNAGWKTVTVT